MVIANTIFTAYFCRTPLHVMLCLNILLLAAVWFIRDGAFQPTTYDERCEYVFAEILSGADLTKLLKLRCCSLCRTEVEQSVDFFNIKLDRNSVINLRT